MSQFVVRGAVDQGRDKQEVDLGPLSDAFQGRPMYRAAFQFQPAERGEPVETHRQEGDADDVVEVRYADGSTRWMNLGRLNDEFGQRRRGAGEQVISVDSFPETVQRGGLKAAVQGVGLLGVDLPDLAGKHFAKWLGEKIEGRLGVEEGLYLAPSRNSPEIEPGDTTQAKDISTSDPNLIYIHGTGSHCVGGFGTLWLPTKSERKRPDSAARWGEERLRRWDEFVDHKYGERVFAFEHRTISRSPIDNAIGLLESLPKGARLHLISHSRGGLVGELIARGSVVHPGDEPITPAEIKAYGRDGKDGREQQQESLKKLNQLLKERRPIVERFVRVACPTSGTTLADGKLDDWLSGFASLIEKFLPIGENDIYYVMKAVTLAVVKQKADPSVLPGLEAMMSDSALVRLINTGKPIHADLSAIAGDTDSSWIPWMWPVDRFFQTAQFPEGRNDLVVPTRSMNTGHRRIAGQSRTFEDRGTSVNHFNYFSNRKTFERLVAALRREDGDAGFTPLYRGEERRESDTARGTWTREPRPRVILLPGISGSHLQKDDDRIWLQYHEIILGQLTELGINKPNISSDGVIQSYYRDLTRFLEATHKVRELSYDWRCSLSECADRLEEVINAELKDEQHAGQPIRILAHSMGGLVARVWMAKYDKTWRKVRSHPDSRFLMLGTPNQGAYAIPNLLLGRDSLIRMLARWDLRNSKRKLLRTFVRFPGMLTLLPQDQDESSENANDESNYRYLRLETWTNLQANDTDKSWPLPRAKDLQATVEDWDLLDRSKIDEQKMIYVAGTASETAAGITVGPDGVTFKGTSRGDGRVTWESGIPEELTKKNRVWYMPAAHGDLCRHKPAFPALQDLLQTGTTSRLPKQPVIRRGLEVDFVLRDRPVCLFPDEDMLLAAAMGGSTTADKPVEPGDQTPMVRIGITHGDLHHESERPIVVGHYVDDAIVNAEQALDQKLQGRLRELRDLRVYPEQIGASEILLQGNSGAIVVGLGVVGQLNPSSLKRTLRDGLIRYVYRIADRDRSEFKLAESAHLAIPVASLLVGSGAGGVSLEESITCLLGAVQEANRLLAQNETAASICDVQLIELFEDSAISAAKCLQKLSNDPAWRDIVTFDCQVEARAGGCQRNVYAEAAGWARRVQIIARVNGTLVYSTPTDRARVEENVQPTQRRLIDRFVHDASRLTRRNLNLENTLFQLLVPNRLKQQWLQQTNTVVMLDWDTARYPWELLNDHRDKSDFESDRPLATQYSLIRQLSTSDYRQRPKSTKRNTALVIGDPVSEFPELVGAQREAQAVADRLHESAEFFDVASLIREEANASDAIQSLFAGDYRVVHLAGHGVHQHALDELVHSTCEKSSRVTGMVLGEGVYLTAVEVEQMTVVPELVFINCCLLGRIEPDVRREHSSLVEDRGALAANLATQFIKMGVRCVVAAGWEVEDNAAQTFAREFYDALLEGRTFADAVRRARTSVFEDHRDTNTWGAYQCYGDPEYRLVGVDYDSPTASERDYVSDREPEVDVHNIANLASKETSFERRRQLLDRLDAIYRKLADNKSPSTRLLCAFGKAYSELDQFQRAIECYTDAIKGEDSDLPFAAIEQRANLRVRSVARRISESAAQAKVNEAGACIDQAIDEVERLNRFHKTEERCSIIGSAYKRHAAVLRKTGTEGSAARLQKSKQAYEQAAEFNENAVYPQLNIIGLEIARCWSEDAALDTDDLRTAMDVAKSQLESQVPSSFWERSYHVDMFLYECLVKEGFQAQVEEIIGRYKELRRYGSVREFASVADQLNFLIYFAPDDVKLDLERILEALRGE